VKIQTELKWFKIVMWLVFMLLTLNFWVPSLEREPPKILSALY